MRYDTKDGYVDVTERGGAWRATLRLPLGEIHLDYDHKPTFAELDRWVSWVLRQ